MHFTLSKKMKNLTDRKRQLTPVHQRLAGCTALQSSMKLEKRKDKQWGRGDGGGGWVGGETLRNRSEIEFKTKLQPFNGWSLHSRERIKGKSGKKIRISTDK